MTLIFKTANFYWIALFVFSSCGNSENETTLNIGNRDTLVQKDNIISSRDDDNSNGSFQLESYNNQEVVATYQSASMYAAATHYYFETEEGEEILVIESIEHDTPVKLPKNMLEELEPGEGPPEGNPELIGNIFKLYFNDKGDVYKVIPVK